MFSVSTSNKSGFDLIVLTDTHSNSQVEISPSCGGILQGFFFYKNGRHHNVISSYNSKDDFIENITAKGFRGCKLSPFACRINLGEYVFEKQTYKIEKFYLGKNAIHGLLYDQPFDIIEMHADEHSAKASMQFSYKATDAGYPFFYDCLITYLLLKNNELVVETQVKNTSDKAIPVQDGWHPYFTFDKPIDQLQLKLHADKHWIFNEEMIPTGESEPYEGVKNFSLLNQTRFDDCFSVIPSKNIPHAVLKDPVENIQLEVYANSNYPFLQLYTPPQRDCIAIENLSGLPDCFNNHNGEILLAPGEVKNFKATYTIRDLSS